MPAGRDWPTSTGFYQVPLKKPAETTYVVYAFVNGRWTGILSTADKDHAEFMANDVIEGGGKAKVEEFPKRKK